MYFYQYIHACCPIWVKFGKSLSEHNTFSIGKFWKSGKGSTFLLGINEMMFRHAKWNCKAFYVCRMPWHSQCIVLQSIPFRKWLLTEACHRDVSASLNFQCRFKDFVARDNNIMWHYKHWQPVQLEAWGGWTQVCVYKESATVLTNTLFFTCFPWVIHYHLSFMTFC